MRIAFISWELPPATGGGGIGTYLTHVIPMLVEGGHEVEVFAGAGRGSEGTQNEGGALVHRCGRTVPEFLELLGSSIQSRHLVRPFDVAESPEYLAQSIPVRRALPELPLVVKLHTPGFLVDRLNFVEFPLAARARWHLGALRRLTWPRPLPRQPQYSAEDDAEAIATYEADQVSAPSTAIWDVLQKEWNLPTRLKFAVPLPFRPDARLLELPVQRSTNTLLFVGRIEARKGICELVRALPDALRRVPEMRVRLVGRSHGAPDGRGDFADWVRRQLARFGDRVECPGAVDPASLPAVFGNADVAIFPSRWESFGYVCLEAMAAGCAVIGSQNGGMLELLDHGRSGCLVDPFSTKSMSDAIVTLFRDRACREQLATRARERVLTAYSPGELLAEYEQGYELAIANHSGRRVRCQN